MSHLFSEIDCKDNMCQNYFVKKCLRDEDVNMFFFSFFHTFGLIKEKYSNEDLFFYNNKLL